MGCLFFQSVIFNTQCIFLSSAFSPNHFSAASVFRSWHPNNTMKHYWSSLWLPNLGNYCWFYEILVHVKHKQFPKWSWTFRAYPWLSVSPCCMQCTVARGATFCDAPKQLPVVECENLCNSVSWQSVRPLRAADVSLSDCALCASVLVFLKEGKTCQGERPASTVDDTLDKYLIALQQKNR